MINFKKYFTEAKKIYKFDIDPDALLDKWKDLEKLGDIVVPKKGAYSITIDPKDEAKLSKILGKGALK